jgi:hypothetical protein
MKGGTKTRTQQLRDAVKKLFIPYILSRGFHEDKRELFKPDPYGHLRRRFMRWNGNKLELLNIQFDKHGRPKFVLNFGVVPPEGVETLFEYVKQIEADVVHLPVTGRLYNSNRYLMRWFGFPLIRIPLIRDPSAEDIVRRAIRLFPQVEAWLREGKVGPNVRVHYRVPVGKPVESSILAKGAE